MVTASPVTIAVPAARRPRLHGIMPAAMAAAAGFGCAVLGHRLVPAVGVLTFAVGLGVAAANVNLLPAQSRARLGFLTKKLLRTGVMLLGFSVSFAAVAALGAPVLAIVAS